MTSAGDAHADRDPEPGEPAAPGTRRPPAMVFVIVLTVVVAVFALVVALWMYWLGGALRV